MNRLGSSAHALHGSFVRREATECLEATREVVGGDEFGAMLSQLVVRFVRWRLTVASLIVRFIRRLGRLCTGDAANEAVFDVEIGASGPRHGRGMAPP